MNISRDDNNMTGDRIKGVHEYKVDKIREGEDNMDVLYDRVYNKGTVSTIAYMITFSTWGGGYKRIDNISGVNNKDSDIRDNKI